MSSYIHDELPHCLTGKSEEKRDGVLKSNDNSFRTGQKSMLAEGTEFQNCVIPVCICHNTLTP